MRSPLLILLPLFLVLILACSHSEKEEAMNKHVAVIYSESYAPSHFKEEDRFQRIGQVLAMTHPVYKETMEANHLPGLAYGVVVDDSLLFFGGRGSTNLETGEKVSEHSLFRIASMSKSFTAMAILKLRDEGKLALSDPAATYLPELEQLVYLSGDSKALSIFNLLTMTAGFPEDNPWGDRFLDMSDEDLLEQVKEGISFSSVPATQYEYSNLGFGLLGQIIKKVSGRSYQDYITENILRPLGMNHTLWEYSMAPDERLAQGYRWEDEDWVLEALLHDGAFGAMGGLITSIADFSKYIRFHLAAWPPRSDPDTGPVRRSTVREMHAMYNPRYYTDTHRFGDHSSPIMRAYGYGLVSMLDHDGILEVGHNGGLPGFGSSYVFYPQHGIGIMAFSNLTYVGSVVRKANYKVISELIEKKLFVPRTLPVSDILERRKEQVAQLIQHWDPELEKEIVAANLYLDISRERRMKEAGDVLNKLGEIVAIGPVIPENQLRGSFLIQGKEQKLRIYFTLSPEAEPRVQWLTLDLIP